LIKLENFNFKTLQNQAIWRLKNQKIPLPLLPVNLEKSTFNQHLFLFIFLFIAALKSF
jgi:hypothetical protein